MTAAAVAGSRMSYRRGLPTRRKYASSLSESDLFRFLRFVRAFSMCKHLSAWAKIRCFKDHHTWPIGTFHVLIICFLWYESPLSLCTDWKLFHTLFENPLLYLFLGQDLVWLGLFLG